MVGDDSTSRLDRAEPRIGEQRTRDSHGSVSLALSARHHWAETVRRLAPGLWASTLSAGFAPAEAAVVCRLAWLSLAQDWNPQHTSDDDIRATFAAVIECQRRLGDARALRGTSGVTPGGAALLVAL